MTPLKKFQVLAIFTTVALLLYCWGPLKMRGVTNYWISPTGSDSGGTNPCTNSASPCLTFAYAIPKLGPGDQLRLKDGNYTSGTTGFLHINCSSSIGDAPRANAANGTSLAGITVTADHERLAHITGNGTINPVYINGCSYWTLTGFYVTEIDGASPPGEEPGSPFTMLRSTQVLLNRHLIYGRNRTVNSHGGIDMVNNQNGFNLVQENEFLCYGGRYPGFFDQSNLNTWRRNYGNNRTADSGCDHIDLAHRNSQGPNESFKTYNAHFNNVESNIFEQGEDVADDGTNNVYKGNIFLSQTGDGLLSFTAYGTGGGTYRDNAIVNAFRGLYILGTVSPPTTTFDKTTIIDASEIGFYSSGTPAGNNAPSGYAYGLTNTLVLRSASAGLALQDSGAYNNGLSFDYTNAFGNTPNFSVSTNGFRTHDSTTDPAYGTCKLWQPAGSPMLGAGLGGSDIGATILYEYKFGTLQASTSAHALWNSNGTWASCGAIVAGVNDVAGKSCFDVNTRLNVQANGCNLPAGYNAANAATPTPTNTPTITLTFTPTPTPSPTFTPTPTPTWTPGGPTVTPNGQAGRMYQCPGFVIFINQPVIATAGAAFNCPTRTPTP
jgi:hypothetical protein